MTYPLHDWPYWSPLAIASGGAVGTLLRFYGGLWVRGALNTSFPLATMLINTLGCFLIGALYAFLLAKTQVLQWNSWLTRMLMVGFLGGFTTFSAFTLEAWIQFHDHGWTAAIKMIVIHLSATLLATVLGFYSVKALT